MIKKIIFGTTPKCGCQHVKEIYNCISSDKIIGFRYDKLNSMTDRYKDYNIIIIIRNPYERLVSGFREKFNNDWMKRYYSGAYKIQGFEYDDLTFSAFVEELEKNGTKHIDAHHFQPQTSGDWTDDLLSHGSVTPPPTKVGGIHLFNGHL